MNSFQAYTVAATTQIATQTVWWTCARFIICKHHNLHRICMLTHYLDDREPVVLPWLMSGHDWERSRDLTRSLLWLDLRSKVPSFENSPEVLEQILTLKSRAPGSSHSVAVWGNCSLASLRTFCWSSNSVAASFLFLENMGYTICHCIWLNLHWMLQTFHFVLW